MTLKEYQDQALDTHSRSPLRLQQSLMGLSAQAGRLCSIHRRSFRQLGRIDNTATEQILNTLGDALWYISDITSYLDADLTDVARLNLIRIKETSK